MVDGRHWLNGLPPELGPQRRLLEGLLNWCEDDIDARWLTVGCSLERGNADPLSDLDVAIGIREAAFERALPRVREAVGHLGDLVEAFDYLMPLSFPLHRFFAQYRDRTQVDLTVGCAPAAYIPRSIVLYAPDGIVHVLGDAVLDPNADEVRTWACRGWEALVNVGKYLRRGSYWEALSQLEQARDHLFRLWALTEQVSQARYGVTALIDAGVSLPPGIERSLPGSTLEGLLAAARYLAEMLTELQRRLGKGNPYELPHAFADFVTADLAQVGSATFRAD